MITFVLINPHYITLIITRIIISGWGAREKLIKKSVDYLNQYTRASIAKRRADVNRGADFGKDLVSRWIIKGQ